MAAILIASLPPSSRPGAQEIAVETKLVAHDGAEGHNFASAIAIDGDVMVVAAPWADVGGIETSGAVYVFLHDPSSGGVDRAPAPAPGQLGPSATASSS